MDVKYFMRTVEGHDHPEYPDYIEYIVDREHRYVRSYIDALYQIDQYNAVLMEDDIVLCNNFKEEIEKVIEQYPNTIINFFTSPERYFTTHYRSSFSYNQCTYFPKGMTKELADGMMKMYHPEETPGKPRQRYGSLLSIVLQESGIPHLVYRPALVQHIDATSTFDGLRLKRNTIYFKDYLDKAGIKIEDAYQIKNQEILKALREADRMIWYKD